MDAHRRHHAKPLVLGLAVAALAATPAAVISSSVTSVAQEAESLPVVGFYARGSRDTRIVHAKAFIQGMEDLGYHEGWNVHYDLAFAEGNPDLEISNAEAMVAAEPRAIVLWGSVAMETLAAATSTVPIVAANTPEPNMAKLVHDFGHPDGNVIGRTVTTGSAQEQMLLPLARELQPDAETIGYLINSGQDRQPIIDLAASYGFKVVFGEAKTSDDVVPAFTSVVAEGADVVLVRSGTRFVGIHDDIAEAARTAGIPTIYYARAQAPLGRGCDVGVVCPAGGLTGLMSIGEDDYNNMRVAAYLVDRILRGESPADIPITEAPLLLRVNLAAAEELGLTIPDSILARATVIDK